jgi:hypothetical protein
MTESDFEKLELFVSVPMSSIDNLLLLLYAVEAVANTYMMICH